MHKLNSLNHTHTHKPHNKHMDTSRETQRFQAYYIDYLLNYESIGSYAAAHGLTYETAQHRIKTGERVHLAHTESATCDTLAATGLAFF
jgi:hypothetical protein